MEITHLCAKQKITRTNDGIFIVTIVVIASIIRMKSETHIHFFSLFTIISKWLLMC